MTDNAGVIRDGLTIGHGLAYEHEQPWPGDVFAALDALVAELDDERARRIELETHGIAESLGFRDTELEAAQAVLKDCEAALLKEERRRVAAEADRDRLVAALKGLLEDDELCRYPPDGDECFCSSCQRIREARIALVGGNYFVKAAGLCHPTKPNYPEEE